VVKPAATNYFLPGQAPATALPPTAASKPQPTPTSNQRSPSPPTHRKPPRKKKPEGKIRHFNDEFSSQTGRFKVGGFVNDLKAAQLPAVHRGTGPYSSMYRMGAHPSDTPVNLLPGAMSPAPSQGASTTHQAAAARYPLVSTTASASSSRPAPSSNLGVQSKASGSKTSSKHRSSTTQSTTERPPGQPSEVNPQYYRRDYERDGNRSSSKGKEPSRASKDGASLTSRSNSYPQDSASSLNTNPNSGDNHASSSSRRASA
jgi:hypothetical protein